MLKSWLAVAVGNNSWKMQSRALAYLQVWAWEWDVGTLPSPPEGSMSVDSCLPLFKKLFSVIYQFTSLFKTMLH